MVEVPHLVDDEHRVPFFHVLFQFGSAPGPSQTTLVMGMIADPLFSQKGAIDVLLDARKTQYKDQFTSTTVQ